MKATTARGTGLAAHSQFWSMPEPYSGSVTLSRDIFLLAYSGGFRPRLIARRITGDNNDHLTGRFFSRAFFGNSPGHCTM